jgi:acetylornithine deacetylase
LPEVVEYLRDLIRCGPGVNSAVELTCETAEALGFAVEVRSVERARIADHPAFLGDPEGEPFRYVVARRGDGGSIVLNGHLDVVEVGEGWTHPPFAADVVDGNIYGRGASDAKGPFAALLFGAAASERDVTVVAATDEEVGGMSTLASLVDGVTGDVVIVGEPTELNVAPASRGFSTFRLTVRGKHAHTGAAFEGENAIVKMARCVTALDTLQHELDRRYPCALYEALPVGHIINIGVIRGGEWTRSVPDLCTAEGSIGVIGDDDPDVIRAAFEEAVPEAEVEWLPMALLQAITPSDHPFVQTIVRAAGAAKLLPLLGASDYRFYARYFGIPGAHFGPGSMRRGHGVDEFVEIEQVVAAEEIVAATVRDWGGAAEQS